MKRVLRVLIVLLIAISQFACSGKKQTAPDYTGRRVPFARFVMLDGERSVTEDLFGRPSVIIFWATWCHFSRPTIEKIARWHEKPNNRSRVNVLAVSVDTEEKLAELKERIQGQNLRSFSHAFSGNGEYDEAYIALGGNELPYILVLDSNGTVVASGDSASIVFEHLGS